MRLSFVGMMGMAVAGYVPHAATVPAGVGAAGLALCALNARDARGVGARRWVVAGVVLNALVLAAAVDVLSR